MDIFALVIAPALVGVLVGLLSGLLGIGGGTVLVPVFRLAFGMSPFEATATSLFTIIPTSVSGAISHMRGKTCLPVLGVVMGIGGACTSPVGVGLANLSPGWLVMVASALVIGYSAINMLRKAWKMAPVRAASNGATNSATASPLTTNTAENGATQAPAAPVAAPSTEESALAAAYPLTKKQLIQGLLIGAIAGALSGYVGLGGGFLMVPLMVSILGLPMKVTSGTSLIAVMILAVPAAVSQALLGNVEWVAGIMVAIGSIPAAAIGARLVQRIPERALRFAFGGFLIVGALLLVANEVIGRG